MASLIDDDDLTGNMPEYSVSELSGAVKRMVEGEFGHVRVRGEVGRVSRPPSGHVYLDLKDDRAVLSGIIWKGKAADLTPQPEEGMEVIATGRLTTFALQSRYQIVIEALAPAGVGALMAMLEKRRQALAAQGLFDEERKRPLPYLPRTIGVVTSPSGAVIRDILKRLAERFPVRVVIWPATVQGEKCATEVAAAIRGFSAMQGDLRPDVVIVARGGGSVEDLWGFNEEITVRAAAESKIPLISAIGHETDTTLIDHAADYRASTPTAAAEAAVPVRADLLAALTDLQARRLRALQVGFDRRRQRLVDLTRALPRPDRILAERRQRMDVAAARLPRPARMLAERRQALALTAARLDPALARHNQAARVRLTRTTARLAPTLMTRRTAEGAERLSDRTNRLAPAFGRTRDRARDRLAALSRTLEAYSCKQTLARGYALVRDGAGKIVARLADGPADGRLEIEFADGRLPVRANGGGRPAARKSKRSSNSGSDQGSLL